MNLERDPDPTKAPGSAALFIGPAAQISNPETERVKRSLQEEILTVAKETKYIIEVEKV